jgi:hypothetical protein
MVAFTLTRRRVAAASRPSVWRLALASALLLLLGGCSLVGLAYQHADLWLLHQAESFVPLRPAQRARLEAALRDRLAQHRARELPAYVALLDRAQAAAADGLTTAEVESLLSRVQALAADLVRGTAPAIAVVLADLDEAQRARLTERLRAGDADYAADYVLPGAEKRSARRAKTARRQLAHWTGDLTAAQRERVVELTRAWPDVADRWHAYRVSRTDGLLALLQGRAGAAEIERYLVSRWVRHEGQPADLARDVAATRTGMIGLIVALDGSLSPTQRKALLDRLRAYRSDLAALLPHDVPAVAAVGAPDTAARD